MKDFFKFRCKFVTIVLNAWICVALLAALPCVSMAADLPPIDDVIGKLQHIYEKTNDFHADFVQKTFVKSAKKTTVEEGSVFFKNPKNMLWKYTKPEVKKLIINSRKAWLYLPQEKIAYTQNADNIFKSKMLIKFLIGLGKLKDEFSIEYAKPDATDKDGNYLLLLTPVEKNPLCESLNLTVDKNNLYILQVSFDDVFGNFTTLNFSNISMNKGITEKIFEFKPPAGVQIFKVP